MPVAKVIGTGSYLPAKVITNADLESMVDTTDEWIVARTGIHERHIAADDETTCDLAEKASVKALKASATDADELDLILVATSTADYVFPSVASQLQERLEAKCIAAMDMQAACAGFVYAVEVADQYIRTGKAKKILIVGAETMSRIVDWNDRGTCILFADGGGAVVLEATDEDAGSRIISTHLRSDGRYRELLRTTHGPSTAAQRIDNIDRASITMRGNEVFRIAVNKLGEIVDETLEANHMDKSQIDWLVPHQANIRIISATARKLGMDMDKVIVTIGHHGNTSAASIPLAFDEAVRDGRIQRGQTVLMEAFGGGFVWGSVLLCY